MSRTPRFHVFFFADGTKLIAEEPITLAAARKAKAIRCEIVRSVRWNPMLRSQIAAARAAGKMPPALPIAA